MIFSFIYKVELRFSILHEDLCRAFCFRERKWVANLKHAEHCYGPNFKSCSARYLSGIISSSSVLDRQPPYSYN